MQRSVALRFVLVLFVFPLLTLSQDAAYGTIDNPGVSCNDIYKQTYGTVANGYFYIDTGDNVIPVYCSFENNNGLTMIYKVSSGVSGNALTMWNDGNTNMYNVSVLNTNSNGHYANSLINTWQRVQKVYVRLYKAGAVQREMIFSPGQDSKSWFSPQNVISSPWSDLPTNPSWQVPANGQFFSIDGDSSNNRAFYVNNNWGGCPADQGWLLVSYGGDVCDGSFGIPSSKIQILYSPGSTKVQWSTANEGYADSFAIFVQLYEDSTVREWETSVMSYYLKSNNASANNTVPDNTTVLCRFGTLVTRGITVSNTIKCVTPPMTAGTYSFDYSFDNSSTWYATCTSLVVIRGRAADQPEYDDVLDGTPFNVTWNPSSFTTNVDLHLFLYVVSVNYSQTNLASAMMVGYQVIARNLPNSGLATVMMPNISLDAVGYAIGVVPTSGNYKRDLGAFFDILGKIDTAVDILKEYIDIPPTVIKIAKWGGRISGVYTAVETVVFVYQNYCHGNYCGSQKICINQNRVLGYPTDPVDQSCLDFNNCVQNTIFDDVCYKQFRKNLWKNVLSGNCDLDCSKAALVQIGSSYIIKPLQRLFTRDIDIPKKTVSGTGYGDVHYTSLDGCYFTFNGVGEYTLVQNTVDPTEYPDFVVQVYALPYEQFPRAALAHGIAIRYDVFGVSVALYANNLDADIYIDNQRTIIPEGCKYRFRGGILSKNQGTFQIDLDGGYSVKLKTQPVAPDFFWEITVVVPDSAFNSTSGLLGLYDGNKENDFYLSNGTIFSGCYPQYDGKLNDFGFSWSVPESQSLFFHRFNPSNATTYNNNTVVPTSEPQTNDTAILAICNQLPEELRPSCLFDMSVINDTSVVNATQAVGNSLQFLKQSPQGIHVGSLMTSTVTLSWTPPNGTVDVLFDVEIQKNDWFPVGRTNLTSTFISGLSAGNSYNARIRSVNPTTLDVSDWVYINFTTGGCAPQCALRSCGDDGCGGNCGSCSSGLQCSPQYVCVPITTTGTVTTAQMTTGSTTAVVAATTGSASTTGEMTTGVAPSTSTSTTGETEASDAAGMLPCLVLAIFLILAAF